MKFQGALVKEQGVTFGIIVVKPHVLNSPSEADSMRTFGVRDGAERKGSSYLLWATRHRQLSREGADAGYSLA